MPVFCLQIEQIVTGSGVRRVGINADYERHKGVIKNFILETGGMNNNMAMYQGEIKKENKKICAQLWEMKEEIYNRIAEILGVRKEVIKEIKKIRKDKIMTINGRINSFKNKLEERIEEDVVKVKDVTKVGEKKLASVKKDLKFFKNNGSINVPRNSQ